MTPICVFGLRYLVINMCILLDASPGCGGAAAESASSKLVPSTLATRYMRNSQPMSLGIRNITYSPSCPWWGFISVLLFIQTLQPSSITLLRQLSQVLFEQLKFFFNLYFLMMALLQFMPEIRIGPIYVYWIPLGFVWSVTLCREAVDDILRHRRDKEVNNEKYYRLARGFNTPELVPSSKLRVGDLVSFSRSSAHLESVSSLRLSDKLVEPNSHYLS